MPVIGSQTSPPVTAQLNFRQMASELLQWNPDLDPILAKRFINNAYRKVLDHRNWYGCFVRGILAVPSMYSVGTATFTNGSDTVTGVGTTWTAAMVGLQVRAGFSTPTATIVAVPNATTITMDQLWAPQTLAGIGYQIFSRYVSFGANVRRLLYVINQFQGYRMRLNLPQEALNEWDAWRATVGFTWAVASYAPSPAGEPLYELYPIPITQQGFPFLAYIQPPDFVNDEDCPPLWIRSDVIVLKALPDALLHRGKASRYYDPNTATFKMKESQLEIEKMARNDDNAAMRNLRWEFEKYPFAQFGATFGQSHDVDY